jgi:hypothetical protein
MAEPLRWVSGKVYFDAKFGANEGWYKGTVFKINGIQNTAKFLLR